MYLILPPPLLSPKAAAPPPQPGPKVQAAFCLLYWPPCSLWGSWARGQTRAAVVTCATAAPAPDPFTRCTGPGREPAPWRCRDTSDPVVPQGELPGNFFFCLFKTSPAAYGVYQARGRIGAAATGLHHSHSNHQILNLPSKARD